MAEAIGVIGSTVSIVEASQKLFRFARDVLQADKQRDEFLQRLSCLETVSKAIDACKATQPGQAWVKLLDPTKKNSPAHGLVKTIEKMEKILKIDVTDMSLKTRLKNFRWHSERRELDAFFDQIKDHCTSILLVLGWGEMAIMNDIGSITRTTAANLDRIEEIMERDRAERQEVDSITKKIASDLDVDRKESRDVAAITREMATKMQSLEASLEAERSERKLLKDKSDRKEVEIWLSPLEFQSRRQTIFEKAGSFHKGQIGQWFLEGDEFKYWKQGRIKVCKYPSADFHLGVSQGVLRGYGEPGAGKTILSSVIVNELIHKSPQIPVICIYLEKSESLAHTTKNLRGSLLKQLVQFRESGLRPAIRAAFDKASRTNTAPDDTETIVLLRAEIEFYQQVYLIVDGLDEASDEARWFIQRDLPKLSSEWVNPWHLFPIRDITKLNVLVMSRPDEAMAQEDMFCDICDSEFIRPCVRYHHCEDCFKQSQVHVALCCGCRDKGKSCPKDVSHTLKDTVPKVYEVKIETPIQDIEFFVRSSIEDEMPEELSSTDMSSPRMGVKELVWQCFHDRAKFGEIVSYISEHADGRFLLAREYVKSFKNKKTLRDINSALKNRKDDGSNKVFPFYKENMVRIMKQEEDDADLARQILSLVYYAKRNLKLVELQQALATRLEDTKYDPTGTYDQRTILNVTKGLVGIDRDTTDEDKDLTVRFDHLTRREYFDQSWKEWFPKGKIDIANTCLTFLSFDEISEPCSSEAEFKIKEKQLPFISYAVQFWGDHVRDAGPGASEIVALAVKYLQDPARIEAYIQAAWTANTRHRDKWDVRRTIHPLHICGWFDLVHLIPELGYDTKEVNIQEETHGQTPLMYACRRGNFSTVRRFLEYGALVNKRSEKGRTALFEAILRLKKDYNSEDNIDKILRIVELLLHPKLKGNQLDVNIRNPRLLQRTALIVSIEHSQTDIALTILRHPSVKVNLQDLEGTTALCFAACNGLVEVVQQLVNFPGINIDLIEKGEERTALLLAAKYSCHPEVVSLLLGKGADPNKSDSKGGTALLRAIEAGNEGAFKILVESKDPLVDLSCADNDGRTLMHWAAEAGKVEAIEMLNEKRPMVNARDNFGMTPLHDACRCGKLEAARLLLDKGADSTIEDKDGRTPLTVARQYGHAKIIEIWDNGSSSGDESVRTMHQEELPIWSLATLRRLDLITEVLSSKRVPLDVTEPRTRRSALHCVLLDNEKDLQGENIQAEILRILLIAGTISPDEPDRYNQTPLHFAAIFGNVEATNALLEHITELDAVDQFGLTPLIIAYKNKNFAVATALIAAGAIIDETRLNLEDLLFAALKLQNEVAVGYLIRAGADRMAQDEEGRTPDMVAEQAKDKKLTKILKATKSTRWKATTMTKKTDFGVSDLENIIEEVDEMLDEVSDGKVADNGVTFGGIPAKQIRFTPFSSRSVNLGKGMDITVDDLKAKQVPSIEFRPRRVEDVEEMLDRLPTQQVPCTSLRPKPGQEPMLCT